jgi:hypothetical protein
LTGLIRGGLGCPEIRPRRGARIEPTARAVGDRHLESSSPGRGDTMGRENLPPLSGLSRILRFVSPGLRRGALLSRPCRG